MSMKIGIETSTSRGWFFDSNMSVSSSAPVGSVSLFDSSILSPSRPIHFLHLLRDARQAALSSSRDLHICGDCRVNLRNDTPIAFYQMAAKKSLRMTLIHLLQFLPVTPTPLRIHHFPT